jgi:uncharacterized integral membrane protein
MASSPETKQGFSDNQGVRTMFMVSGRNQLQLIAIADKKANMITVLASITIFMIVAVFALDIVMEDEVIFNKIEIILPLSILLTFSCVSLICAILALKPKIIRVKKESRSALFFNNFYRKSLSEYKSEMKEMMTDSETIYDHMLTDMYFNGLVLERKYALLSYAYAVFLLAILLSVSSFIITTITH